MKRKIFIGIAVIIGILLISIVWKYQNESDLERFSRKTHLDLIDCGEMVKDHVNSISDGGFKRYQHEEQVHIAGFYTAYDLENKHIVFYVTFELIPNPSDTFEINSIYFTKNRIELETTQYNCEINGDQEMLEIIYAALTADS